MTIYFVRHAEPDFTVQDERFRPLTEKGEKDAKLLAEFFKDINVDFIASSPYTRTVDTVKPIALLKGLDRKVYEGLHERRIGKWFDPEKEFWAFAERQWLDFNYKSETGESLNEVQIRNVIEFNKILNLNFNDIIVSTHGTALCTILNYIDKKYGYVFFKKIAEKMPYIIKIEFQNGRFTDIEEMEFKKNK